MGFYIVRVLFPALLIDIPVTIGFLKKSNLPRLYRWITALIPAPLYLINTYMWMRFYGGDPRFQGQGAIGFLAFFGFGVLFFVIRLLIGLSLLVNKK